MSDRNYTKEEATEILNAIRTLRGVLNFVLDVCVIASCAFALTGNFLMKIIGFIGLASSLGIMASAFIRELEDREQRLEVVCSSPTQNEEQDSSEEDEPDPFSYDIEDEDSLL